jgi:chondroitin AC lyase
MDAMPSMTSINPISRVTRVIDRPLPSLRSARWLVGACLLVAWGGSFSVRADEFATVSARIRADLLASGTNASTVQADLAALSSAGRWSDVNYADRSITNWSLREHLNRMVRMAKAYADPASSLAGSTSLRDGIIRAYDAFVSLDPRSDNWYFNEIATPQLLGQTILLTEPQLGASRVTAGLAIVARSYQPRSVNSGTNTGANRIDRAYASLIRGVVTRSSSLTSESFLAVGDTVVVTPAEGIQVDGSYYQHGPQLSSASYGVTFTRLASDVAALGAGTSFAMPAAKVQTMADFLLDGQQWMIRGTTFEWTAMGRSHTRAGVKNNGLNMLDPVRDALAMGAGRRDELQAMERRLSAARTSGRADPALALVGSRHFWRSDITTHHRPDFYTSVKISSTRTLQPESGNGEGLQNLHLADGVTLIMQRGDEYDGIFPVWDWRRLPGTTTEQANYSLKPASDWGVAGTSTFAGGASDGMYSLTVFDYDRRGVGGHKSWFFFDDEFVALGAGIDATSATGDVITTVNQTFRRGSTTWGAAGGQGGTLTTGTLSRGDLSWVVHDGIGYVFPSPAQATIRSVSQSGSWNAINSSQSSATVTADVFSLQVDHGRTPRDAGYAYVVLPGSTAAETAAYAAAPGVRILANDRTLQAVRHDGLGMTQAAFFSPGTLAAGGGLSLKVDKPAAVMLHETAGGMRLSASNPAGAATTLRLDVRREDADAAADFARVTLRLPGGELAGSTVSRDLPAAARPVFTAGLRDSAAAMPELLHQWSFEGTDQATRLADSQARAPLVARSYGTQGTVDGIAFGGGLDPTTTAFSPQRLGRSPTSMGGAALVTATAVSLPESFTVEALVRPDLLETGGGVGYAVMAGGWASNQRGYFLAQQEGAATDSLSTIIGDSFSGADNNRPIVNAFQPGHWYYVATTYSRGSAATIVNAYVANVTTGETVATRAVTDGVASGTPPAAASFGIGGLFFDGTLQEAWSGSIDEVAVFNRAFSATDVQARLDNLYRGPAKLNWVAPGALLGGTGTWSSAAANWLGGSYRMGWTGNSEATFSGVGGTVTVQGSVGLAGGMRVLADGYLIQGGTLDVGGADAPVTVDVAAAGGVTITSALVGDAGLRKTGPGRLMLQGTATLGGPLEVAAGRLGRPAAAVTTLVVESLQVDESAGASLDLGAGRIQIGPGGANAEALRADLLAGRNGGRWDGASGIVSAAVAGAGAGARGVGYFVRPDGSAVVAFAAPGDTNLDGMVDILDLVQISAGGRYGSALPANWAQGDVDYDGRTSLFDLVSIASSNTYGKRNYLSFLGTAGTGMVSVAVPEPTGGLGITMAVAVAGIAGIRRRGSRRSCRAAGGLRP